MSGVFAKSVKSGALMTIVEGHTGVSDPVFQSLRWSDGAMYQVET